MTARIEQFDQREIRQTPLKSGTEDREPRVESNKRPLRLATPQRPNIIYTNVFEHHTIGETSFHSAKDKVGAW